MKINKENAKLVSRDEFEKAVGLWRSKGYNNALEVQFNSSTINLFVLDCTNPEVTFYINVLDTDAVDTMILSYQK